VTVEAVYIPIEYTVSFVANGVTVNTESYTIENTKVTEPVAPAKDHYMVAWSTYELLGGDVTVEAIYTPVPYTVTFRAEGAVVSTVTYDMDAMAVDIPNVPNKDFYFGEWEDVYQAIANGGNVEVNAIYTPADYTVTFYADGNYVDVRYYTVENTNISAPEVPSKGHYTGAWESYILNGGNVEVHAVYTPVEYTVTFVNGTQTVATVPYTVENTTITAPAVPAKAHYNGQWEEYFLASGNITVHAIYTPVVYTVSFVTLDYGTINYFLYTVEDTSSVIEPSIPQKSYYTAAWESYTLTGGDVTVNAIYTPIQYTVSYYADGVLVGSATYTVENTEVTAPAVPTKDHYTGSWDRFTPMYQDQTVTASYTPVEYTVTFVNGDTTVGSDTYTVESTEITVPAVPEKAHYTGAWEAYELSGGNLTVKPVYTPVSYSVVFVVDGEVIATETYTIENLSVTEPAIPAKTGYRGAWQSYTVTGSNQTVQAIYTPVKYTVSFDSNGGSAVGSMEIPHNATVVAPSTPTKVGYVFTGWQLNGEAYDFTTSVTGALELTASWAEISTVLTFTYDVATETYSVTGYTGSPTLLVIPATYEGKPVVGIANSAFEDCGTLQSVILADGITSIGENAFYGCWSLSSIKIPDTVTAIGESAFAHCTSLPDIELPNDLTELSRSLFYGCDALTTVALPSGLTTIGNYVFYECNSLRSITIPNSVTTLGTHLFERCYQLSSVVLPSGITSIPEATFFYCTLLTDLELPSGITSIGADAFLNCEFLSSIAIPSSVTSIGAGAFKGCARLTSIELPNGISAISDEAFLGCSSLSSITIPNSVTYIGERAFSSCSALKSVTVPSQVTSLYSGVFSSCTSLTSVSLPGGLTYIGAGAFSGCRSLSEITLPSTLLEIKEYAFSHCKALTEIAIPSGVVSIGSDAFAFCTSLTSFTFPKSMSSVGTRVVVGCDKLTSLTVESGNTSYRAIGNCLIAIETGELVLGCHISEIPDNGTVKSIGNYAFDGCSKLISVVIPEGVTSIGYYAFRDCTSLESITVPSTVTSFGTSAFERCDSLESVSITNLEAWLSASFNYLSSNPLYYAGDLYLNGELVTSVTVPADLAASTIALAGCTSIRTATVENGATAIGDYLFHGCTGLVEVTLPDSVTKIGSSSFTSCKNLAQITLGTNLTSIGSNAFLYCYRLAEVRNLSTSLTVAKNTSNGYVGYYSLAILTDAETPTGVIQTQDGYLFYKTAEDAWLLGYVGNATVLVLPDDCAGSTYQIRDYAFDHELGLTGITFSSGVTKIGNYAFYNCTGLERIVIPNSVTFIGTSAFEGCMGIKSLSLGSGLTGFGNNAFKNCTAVEEFLYNGPNVSSFGANNGIFASMGANGKGLHLTIGASVRQIPAYFFCPLSGYGYGYSHSPNVITITFEEGSACNRIGTYAFSFCYNLRSITIPNFTQSFTIDDRAFEGCEKLLTVYNYCSNLSLTIGSDKNGKIALYATEIITSEDGTTRYWQTDDGFVFYENGDTCYLIDYCGGQADLVLPANCNGKSYAIYAAAFYRNKTITSVVIPEGVTAIGKEAFYDCSSLISVTFPRSLTFCGDDAFAGCSSIVDVHISDLKAWIAIEQTSYASSPLWGAEELYLNGELVVDLVIPDGITEIGAYAFYGYRGLKSVTIPSSVKHIGKDAFASTGIEVVSLQTGLESIGNRAFAHTPLKELIIPDGVLTLGNDLVYSCGSLQKIIIPNSVTDIGDLGLFSISSKLSYNEHMGGYYLGNDENPYLVFLEVSDLSASTYTIHADTKFIAAAAFIGCKNLTHITIPEGVVSVGNEAFSQCSSLTFVIFPKGVQRFGSHLFRECTALRSVVFQEGMKVLNGFTFYGCPELESVILPEGLEEIGDSAFIGCSKLTSITIPSSVKKIGKAAFNGCSSLTKVYIQDALAWVSIEFGDAEANPLYYAKNLYLGGVLLTEVVLKDVETISGYAFCNASSLTKITISESVKKIGKGAFSGCAGLQEAVFAVTDGWKSKASEEATYAQNVSSNTLSTASEAAKYLKNTAVEKVLFQS